MTVQTGSLVRADEVIFARVPVMVFMDSITEGTRLAPFFMAHHAVPRDLLDNFGDIGVFFNLGQADIEAVVPAFTRQAMAIDTAVRMLVFYEIGRASCRERV